MVQVADQGQDDTGRPGALAFRLLVLPRKLYADLEGDVFRIADAFAPPWQARGELPALIWSAGPSPRRTVAEIRRILDVAEERTALLLGGVQALVDHGKLVLRRPAPDPDLARHFWDLLPSATRLELWPASFAFGNKHGFDLAIVPDAATDNFSGYLTEETAGDYPRDTTNRRCTTRSRRATRTRSINCSRGPVTVNGSNWSCASGSVRPGTAHSQLTHWPERSGVR